MTKKQPRSHITAARVITQIPLDQIDPPKFPSRQRPQQSSIEELANSIKISGLLQPISINKAGSRYEIIFGHRRFLAHRFLGRAKIHAEVHNWPTKEVLIARAKENQDRQDIHPWDEALYLQHCSQKLKSNNKTLAKYLSVSEAYISQRLGIFKYPEILQTALQDAKINFSVARELSRIEDPKTLNLYLNSAIDNGATPAVARRWADDHIRYQQAYPQQETPPIHLDQPEQFIPPTGRCYLCDQDFQYQDLKHITVCKQDLNVAIQLLVNEAAQQTAPPDQQQNTPSPPPTQQP